MDAPEHLLHPKWRDMSEWVVHFSPSAANLASILADGAVLPSGPFGWTRNINEFSEAHKSACLSEIPLDHLSRLIERRGEWGIGFNKAFVARSGGARVWYLDHGVGPANYIHETIGQLLRNQDFTSPLWQLTPFIDPLADGDPFTYRFDWEREWRVVGGLEFEPDDVAFVITPDGDTTLLHGIHGWTDPPPALASRSLNSFMTTVRTELWDDVDAAVEHFLTMFIDPANVLPYSTADGGYQWIVPEWQTEEAVEEVFVGEVPIEVFHELNAISPSWVSDAEWADFASDF